MSHSEPARIAARRIRSAILAALVVVSTTTLSPPTALGETDGAVPEGVRVFDDDIPAVANLDPGLLRALRQAARDAAKDGIEIVVNSGWRSREYQKQLLRDAVAKYGSEKEAARWVATPDTSSHVSGDAVDIGPSRATAWLSKHGAGTGYAGSTGTSPGTTNCAPKPSMTVARPCMPTPGTIQGCSSDQPNDSSPVNRKPLFAIVEMFARPHRTCVTRCD